MSDSPIIHADIGDGKNRRFFLGADELRLVKQECGRGYYTIYTQFAQNAEPDEVKALIRLALIGGGESPKGATDLSEYYCSPPRPLKTVYLIAFECLSAIWNGYTPSKAGSKATVAEMDRYFTELDAMFAKNGMDVSALRGKSFADIQEMLELMREQKGEAPDADAFNAIKAMHGVQK